MLKRLDSLPHLRPVLGKSHAHTQLLHVGVYTYKVLVIPMPIYGYTNNHLLEDCRPYTFVTLRLLPIISSIAHWRRLCFFELALQELMSRLWVHELVVTWTLLGNDVM